MDQKSGRESDLNFVRLVTNFVFLTIYEQMFGLFSINRRYEQEFCAGCR